jgi:hypothetical protein
MSSVIDAALASPVSLGLAAHVWQAHEEQVARNKRESGSNTQMRGEVKWNPVIAGYQFVPDENCLDALMDKIADGTWAAGFKVSIAI